jgi:histone acetyltransferase
MIVTAKPRGSRTGDQIVMERLLRDLKEHSLAWAFQQPVSREEVPDYYDHIKDPMGMSLFFSILGCIF